MSVISVFNVKNRNYRHNASLLTCEQMSYGTGCRTLDMFQIFNLDLLLL